MEEPPNCLSLLCHSIVLLLFGVLTVGVGWLLILFVGLLTTASLGDYSQCASFNDTMNRALCAAANATWSDCLKTWLGGCSVLGVETIGIVGFVAAFLLTSVMAARELRIAAGPERTCAAACDRANPDALLLVTTEQTLTDEAWLGEPRAHLCWRCSYCCRGRRLASFDRHSRFFCLPREQPPGGWFSVPLGLGLWLALIALLGAFSIVLLVFTRVLPFIGWMVMRALRLPGDACGAIAWGNLVAGGFFGHCLYPGFLFTGILICVLILVWRCWRPLTEYREGADGDGEAAAGEERPLMGETERV
jgi:hypothetical protein